MRTQMDFDMTRGGKRKGAGRKPSPDKKQTYSTRLRPDQILWLRGHDNAAKEIETALDKHIEGEQITRAGD